MANPAPVRAIGWLSLTAIAVNGMVGAGILILPANVAQLLGGNSLLAYLLAGAAVILVALCFAEAGSMFERSGGPYLYTREAFGPFAGFQAAIMLTLSRVAGAAAISNAFSAYAGFSMARASQRPRPRRRHHTSVRRANTSELPRHPPRRVDHQPSNRRQTSPTPSLLRDRSLPSRRPPRHSRANRHFPPTSRVYS